MRTIRALPFKVGANQFNPIIERKTEIVIAWMNYRAARNLLWWWRVSLVIRLCVWTEGEMPRSSSSVRVRVRIWRLAIFASSEFEGGFWYQTLIGQVTWKTTADVYNIETGYDPAWSNTRQSQFGSCHLTDCPNI